MALSLRCKATIDLADRLWDDILLAQRKQRGLPRDTKPHHPKVGNRQRNWDRLPFIDKCRGYAKFGRKKPLDGTFHQTDAIPEFEKAVLHNVLKFCMEAAILVTRLGMLIDEDEIAPSN